MCMSYFYENIMILNYITAKYISNDKENTLRF